MKKLIAIMAMLAVCSVVMAAKKAAPVEPAKAKAEIVAKVKLAEDGDTLYCRVKFTGVEAGKTIMPVINWTAPEVYYTTKKGTKVLLFKVSDHYDSPPVRTKTKATRTLVTTVTGVGKVVRAVGLWKAEVTVDGVVVGSAELLIQ